MEPWVGSPWSSLRLNRRRDGILGCKRCRQTSSKTLPASCRYAARRWPTPTTFAIMRTPSSRSICETLYGTERGEARIHHLMHDRERVQRASSAGGAPAKAFQRNNAGIARGPGKLQPPQLAQCCSISLPSRAPSKNVALTVSWMGTGLLTVGTSCVSSSVFRHGTSHAGQCPSRPTVADLAKVGMRCDQCSIGNKPRRSCTKPMWFHLMPLHRTGRRFPREEPVGVVRYPFVAVRSEARASDVQCFHGRVGIRGGMRLRRGVSYERHANDYGVTPSPHLIASSPVRRTTDTALCVMSNSLGSTIRRRASR